MGRRLRGSVLVCVRACKFVCVCVVHVGMIEREREREREMTK